MPPTNSSSSFIGGIHPQEMKCLTENLPFEKMITPKQIIIPLCQHAGKPAKPIVKKGSEIKAGEVIAEQDGFVSLPIHSPVSGKVIKIGTSVTPNGMLKESIIIEPNDSDEIIKMPPLNFDTVTPDEIKERIKNAGIVGQGGAAFPTFIKLSPPPDKKISCVIINGCECEPYLTRDYRFMLERANDLISGLRLIMKAVGVDRGIIGVEDNKPEAIKKLKDAAKNYSEISIEVLKTKYPQGAEKMLIKAVIDKEVPPGKLPFDVGCIIQNVGTAIAVNEAVVEGMPQLNAALTVSGFGINQPKNLIVNVGTPLTDVINYCGGVKDDAVKIVVGGPMMGTAQFDITVPVMKATSGILILTKKEINGHEETNCLRCGKCVEVCPLNLVPTKLARLSQLEKFEEVEAMNITVCMECGTCTYSCPANIPLVQWIRLGKQKVLTMQREQQSA